MLLLWLLFKADVNWMFVHRTICQSRSTASPVLGCWWWIYRATCSLADGGKADGERKRVWNMVPTSWLLVACRCYNVSLSPACCFRSLYKHDLSVCVTDWCLVCRWLYWMRVVLGQLRELKLAWCALLLALTEPKVMAIGIGKTFCRTRDLSYWILRSWQTLTRHGKLLSSTADFRYSCWVCVYVSFNFAGAVVYRQLHALSAAHGVTVECLQIKDVTEPAKIRIRRMRISCA